MADEHVVGHVVITDLDVVAHATTPQVVVASLKDVLPPAIVAFGTQGITGPPGEDSTVTVGTTTTLPPGAPATVTNVGGPSHTVLDFGVPQGPQGEQGPQGDLTKPQADLLYDPLGAAADGDVAHLGAADPHPQYLTAAEIPTPILDHGALTGLADDDHPQYLLHSGDTVTGRLDFQVSPHFGYQELLDIATPTTAASAASKAYVDSKQALRYTTTIGNGAAVSHLVTHNMNSRDIHVTVRQTASPYEKVDCVVKFTTVNTLTVETLTAPASGAYTVTVS